VPTPTARRRLAAERLAALALASPPEAAAGLLEVLRAALLVAGEAREAVVWFGLALLDGQRQQAPWRAALEAAASAHGDPLLLAWLVDNETAADIEDGLLPRGRLPDVQATQPAVWRRRWRASAQRQRTAWRAEVAAWRAAGAPPEGEPVAPLPPWLDVQTERRFTDKLTWGREVGRPEHTASPDVVAALLAEREVPWLALLRVAARRPTSAALVEVLVGSDAAMARRELRRALVENPSVPTGVRLALLPGAQVATWRALAGRAPHPVQRLAAWCVRLRAPAPSRRLVAGG
jgi:hypothetical protein